jgi:hypothetical protein
MWIDADPIKTTRISFFGKMNENFDNEKYNTELGEDGLIRALRDCCDEELFTKYGPKYNWDSLKTRALHNLVDEVNKLFPTMKGYISRDWRSIMDSTRHLDIWVRRLIEGRCLNNELHGVEIIDREDQESAMSEVDRLILFLTYGPNSKRYNFRSLDRDSVTTAVRGMSRTRYGRVTKSSLEKFTEFDGTSVTTGYPEAIMD